MLKNQEPTIKAIIENKKPSKNKIYNKYRPAFKVRNDYLTSGEITFLNCSELEYGCQAIANIRFITPELYIDSLYEGKKMPFQEGSIVHGFATVLHIYGKK